ncbi:TIGR03364 family FAD-dependent oxidoreductase [Rhodovarius lipocyclicus]|uniref:TIGR03364 family FAD-dependent oxidoreductase n=1 Tax=Rhodovarius lipocyclicus TaxID=268410 RepID=UPI00135A006C|nr:TIGR03364 family FAD-dependent oxidoreductase [Rhodovarius lipocyclicus]
MLQGYDIAVVGAGILGLAHALAAARRGLKVLVLDKDAQANGASIRNFGFVTVTGQQAGDCWRRAMRSRDVWAEVAPQAGIDILHSGFAMLARRPESVAVLEAFRRTEMGAECELLDAAEAARRFPDLCAGTPRALLWSPHERRVESRDAIPRLAAWLAAAHGVEFRRDTLVRGVTEKGVETADGLIPARMVVVCPNDDFLTLFPERIAAQGVTKCKLHMLRLANPGFRLPGAVMSDLGLVRYLGYSELPEAEALRPVLLAEQKAQLDNGIHLIVVQSADGSLVVGDSHHYGATPHPFAPEEVDRLILEEFQAALGIAPPPVLERWTGIYPSAPDKLMFRDAPAGNIRLVMVTSGTGASTSFAIAEETLAELHGEPA